MKNVHKVIKFSQNAWLKPYIPMNTDLRKKYKIILMNNAIFRSTTENVRKIRDIKLITAERMRNYFVSEPHYHTANFFTENLLAIEMIKTEILMNKLVYLV